MVVHGLSFVHSKDSDVGFRAVGPEDIILPSGTCTGRSSPDGDRGSTEPLLGFYRALGQVPETGAQAMLRQASTCERHRML